MKFACNKSSTIETHIRKLYRMERDKSNSSADDTWLRFLIRARLTTSNLVRTIEETKSWKPQNRDIRLYTYAYSSKSTY